MHGCRQPDDKAADRSERAVGPRRLVDIAYALRHEADAEGLENRPMVGQPQHGLVEDELQCQSDVRRLAEPVPLQLPQLRQPLRQHAAAGRQSCSSAEQHADEPADSGTLGEFQYSRVKGDPGQPRQRQQQREGSQADAA